MAVALSVAENLAENSRISDTKSRIYFKIMATLHAAFLKISLSEHPKHEAAKIVFLSDFNVVSNNFF
jgi:hypothetical protein